MLSKDSQNNLVAICNIALYHHLRIEKKSPELPEAFIAYPDNERPLIPENQKFHKRLHYLNSFLLLLLPPNFQNLWSNKICIRN